MMMAMVVPNVPVHKYHWLQIAVEMKTYQLEGY